MLAKCDEYQANQPRIIESLWLQWFAYQLTHLELLMHNSLSIPSVRETLLFHFSQQ